MFAKERPKSAGPLNNSNKSPLITSRHLKASEISNLNASYVPERKNSKYCQHNNPLLHQPMTDKKRNALLDLKKREDIRATRSRLRAVLLQKLINKFGEKNKVKIAKHVDEFVDSKLQISAADLINLEKNIKEDTSVKGSTPENNGNNNNSNNNSNNSNGPQNVSLPLNNLPIRPATSAGPKTTCRCGCINCKHDERCFTPIPRGSEWHALELYHSYQDNEQIRDEELQKKKKQKEMFNILTKQMQEIEEQKRKEKDEDKSYLQYIQNDLMKYNQENEELLKKQIERNENNRKIWTQQLDDKRAHNQRIKEELSQSEKKELEDIKASIELEKERNYQKKQEEKRRQLQRIKENEEKIKQKQLEKKLDQEENQRYAEEYKQKIEKEELDRQEALNKRIKKLENYSNWIENGPIGQQQRLNEQLELERIEKYQAMKNQQDEERHQREINQRNQINNDIKKENEKILSRKLEEQNKTKKEDFEESLKLKEVAEQNKKEIQERRKKELANQQKYFSTLTQQINSKINELDEMNNIERSLNKDDLTTIRCNPAYHSKVYQRLRMRIASANGPRKPVQGWV